MPSSNILLRPFFWYVFIVLVIVVLFLYGTKISQDKTDLSIAHKELENLKLELESSKNETYKKILKIDSLNETISQQIDVISVLEDSLKRHTQIISEQKFTIEELENRPPKIVVKYLKKNIYKEIPDNSGKELSLKNYPYGKGYGKLALFNNCSDCYFLRFWIDDNEIGTVTRFIRESTSCEQDGTINKIILVGRHKVMAIDQDNRRTTYYFNITENECLLFGFRHSTQK